MIDDYIAANEKYIEYIKPNEEEYNKTEKERGVTNEQLKELGIADSADGLTRREAQEILVLANTRGNRRSSQGQERVSGKDQGAAEATRSTNDIANDTVGEATIVAMSHPNADGYNESDPLGKNLSDLKKEAGNYKSGLPNEAEASTLGSSAKISSADSESPVAINQSLAGSATDHV